MKAYIRFQHSQVGTMVETSYDLKDWSTVGFVKATGDYKAVENDLIDLYAQRGVHMKVVK